MLGIEHRGEEALPSLVLKQAGAELAQDAMVEAGVGQLERKQVLPVDPRSHRVGRLPVRQVLTKLHQCDQRQAPWRIGRLAESGIEVAKDGVIKQWTKPVAQEQESVPTWKRRISDGCRLTWNSRNGIMWAQSHGCYSSRATTPTPGKSSGLRLRQQCPAVCGRERRLLLLTLRLRVALPWDAWAKRTLGPDEGTSSKAGQGMCRAGHEEMGVTERGGSRRVPSHTPEPLRSEARGREDPWSGHAVA